jgi:hypothetical protein
MAHGNYLVFYSVGPDVVTIIHVLSPAMNVEAFLFPEG